jgi:citrate lyase subunit beta/citryl-CoA lyase
MRSLLFVPADRPERFDKACSSGADAVILDLEDAVGPSAKAAARDALANWARPDRNVLVRINAPRTSWFEEDWAMLKQLSGISGIVLPKAERVDEVALLAVQYEIFPLVETALGLQRAEVIGRVPGVQRLLFGSVDFQLDLAVRGDGRELLFFRSQLVWASRLAGLPAPIDGVSTALDDFEKLRADAMQSRAMGFGGKLCIHPRQVAVVKAAFAPTIEEQAWARRVLAASPDGAAVRLNGQMVDRPLVLRAQAIVEEIEAGGIE